VEIRQIESARREASAKQAGDDRTGILALTGMSSLEDKRKAFDAGVDG
jgi:DNA-binding response OmpR family regulator